MFGSHIHPGTSYLAVRFESEAISGTLPYGQNNPRKVRFGLYAEQMTASAFVAPRAHNKNAYLYRMRPAVAHQGFVCLLRYPDVVRCGH